jgi:TolA-binding protein
MKKPVLILIFVAAMLLSSCSHRNKVSNPLADLGSKQPDKVLFDRAMDALQHRKYDVSRLTFQTLINTYPDSEYIARAKLGVADSWYAEAGMPRARELQWPRLRLSTRTSSPSSQTCRRPPKHS